MRSLSDLQVRSYDFSESTSEADLGKILWSVCQILIFSKTKKTNDSAGDTVKVTFDYKLSTITAFLTYLRSLRVKQTCRYLDYIFSTRETSR